jgi:hypothetical protein
MTTISGVSHRSMDPFPSSSVKLPTSGVVVDCTIPSPPIQSHWTSGVKLLGGACSSQVPAPSSSPGDT